MLEASTSPRLVGTSCRRSDRNSHRPNLPKRRHLGCVGATRSLHSCIRPSSHSQMPKTLHIPWPLHVTGDEPEAQKSRNHFGFNENRPQRCVQYLRARQKVVQEGDCVSGAGKKPANLPLSRDFLHPHSKRRKFLDFGLLHIAHSRCHPSHSGTRIGHLRFACRPAGLRSIALCILKALTE